MSVYNSNLICVKFNLVFPQFQKLFQASLETGNVKISWSELIGRRSLAEYLFSPLFDVKILS